MYFIGFNEDIVAAKNYRKATRMKNKRVVVGPRGRGKTLED